MSQQSDESEKSAEYKVVKKQEYRAFIKMLKQGNVSHWVQIARVLNVDKDTITAWKELPEAKQAIADGIEHAMQKMQEAGSKDWRMWEAKLKMLGINPAQAIDLTSDGEKLEPLVVRIINEPTGNLNTE